MKALVFVISFFSIAATADYAWIPEYQNLWLKTGWEFFRSDANYSSEGDSTQLLTANVPSELKQNRFLLEAEYGLGDRWSGLVKTSVLNAQVQSLQQAGSLLDGSGLADTSIGFKWQARQERPVLAVEAALILAPYSVGDLKGNELAIGDGVAGTALVGHLGTKAKHFVFSISPGLLFRYGRFSHQATLESALSLALRKFYLRAFQWAGISLTKENNPSNTSLNNEPQSGGSFSRLSTSPDLLLVGLRAGYRISDKFRTEAHVAKTLWGHTAADSLRLGITLISTFDFFVPDTREKLREVPLNAD